MNLAARHQPIYEFNQKKLFDVCEFIRNLKKRIIIIEGCSGSGKSTVIEALVNNKANIFTSSGCNPYSGSFEISSSESNYIALDETEYFSAEQIVEFLKKAESLDKIALISSQGVELFKKAKKDVFDSKKTCVVHLSHQSPHKRGL